MNIFAGAANDRCLIAMLGAARTYKERKPKTEKEKRMMQDRNASQPEAQCDNTFLPFLKKRLHVVSNMDDAEIDSILAKLKEIQTY